MDYSKIPRICMPYNPNERDYQAVGDLPILLVPTSQCLRTGGINPESMPTVGLSWLKACFHEYYNQNVPLLHICLHSPSMTDDYFISGMDRLIYFISKYKNVNFKFVSEIRKYPHIEYKTRILSYIFAVNKNIMWAVIKKIINARFSS